MMVAIAAADRFAQVGDAAPIRADLASKLLQGFLRLTNRR